MTGRLNIALQGQAPRLQAHAQPAAAVMQAARQGPIGSFGGFAQNRTRFDQNPYWIAIQSARGLIKILAGFARVPYWIAIKSSKDFSNLALRSVKLEVM